MGAITPRLIEIQRPEWAWHDGGVGDVPFPNESPEYLAAEDGQAG